jgi:copper homeostasis protein CutC
MPQIDRVLSSGGTDELKWRVSRLAEYEKAAAPELTIIAGGGVDGDALINIGRETGIREFHVGRAARAAGLVDGDVQAALVKKLVEKMKEI